MGLKKNTSKIDDAIGTGIQIVVHTSSRVRYRPLHRRELMLAPQDGCHHEVLQETKRPFFVRFPCFHIKWNDDDVKETYWDVTVVLSLMNYCYTHTQQTRSLTQGTYNQSSKTEVIKINPFKFHKPQMKKGLRFQKKRIIQKAALIKIKIIVLELSGSSHMSEWVRERNPCCFFPTRDVHIQLL